MRDCLFFCVQKEGSYFFFFAALRFGAAFLAVGFRFGAALRFGAAFLAAAFRFFAAMGITSFLFFVIPAQAGI